MTFDAALHADRRRPFERMEADLVRLAVASGEGRPRPELDVVRYVLAFARLTAVRNPDGTDVDLLGRLASHAGWVRGQVAPRLRDAAAGAVVSAALPALLARTRTARQELLDAGIVHRDALEAEITTRLLAVASGGGGGAGYGYPGAYEMLDRAGLVPDLLAGTSVGAMMSLFRAHQRDYTFTPFVAAARRLSWGGVFQVLDTRHRYGVPATLRVRLRNALGGLFVGPEGGPLRLCDTAIPFVAVATGLTLEGLAHGVTYAEHLPDDDARRSGSAGLGAHAVRVFRELLAQPSALRMVALGRDPGTETFDALDAVGFSSAVPGVLQYDLGGEDDEMRRLLDGLYAADGITRLVEGGLTSNVPARVAWETIASGRFGRRTAFVVALDGFAPNPRRIGWLPLQIAVRAANVDADRTFADLYVPFTRTLSPLNLLPTIRDTMEAVRWGRDEIRPHLAFARAMCAPIRVLPD